MAYETLEIWEAGGPSTAPIAYDTGTGKPRSFNSPSSMALQQCKNEINLFYQEGKWDDYKKITNPYEYVFLSWNRRTSRSVATRQPLSRSYFKMVELWKRLNLTEYLGTLVASHGGFVSAHAAEGPGGFIEACSVISEKNAWAFKSATAITLRSEAKNVPGWRKAARFLATNPQVVIHDGADGTGNILLKENQDAFVQSVRDAHPAGVHLFTADGGFDFSNDYNAQEDSIFPLLLAETLLGLRVLAKGGCLVIKCFDTTEQPTMDLIWLISRSFCEWGIVKPRTSRAGNAERYIVGKGFLGDIEDILGVLETTQIKQSFTLPLIQHPTGDLWKKVLMSMSDLQEKIEHMELHVIRETLDLIKHTDHSVIRRLVEDNVVRSIAWCEEHSEDTALTWTSELDKNISKETLDLLHILSPGSAVRNSYSSWHSRSTLTSHLTFEGFRSPTGIPSDSVPTNNPFMRTKPASTLVLGRGDST
jgi:23S rRNA U2552 (ribose-2'-O)-methylase RlmE/FtsJ